MMDSLQRLSPITALLALTFATSAGCGHATKHVGGADTSVGDVTEDAVAADTAADDAADTAVPDTAAPVCTARATVAPVAPFFTDVSVVSGIRVGN